MISEHASEGASVFSAVRIARLPWAFSAVLVALSAGLLALNRNVDDPVAPYWINLAVSALALSTVGALIASRRPENPIGWLLLSSGFLYAILVSVGEYGTYALLTEHGALPGGVLAAWSASWLYVLGANLILFSFLLFPDGRLPSPRWRVVAWLIAAVMCLDTAALALAPGTLYGFPGVENPFGIEALAHLSGSIGVVTGVLALAAILAPIIALIVRFRRARGDERQQIKWVIYAVTVLVAAIVAVNLWPSLDPSFAGAAMFLVGSLAIPAAIGLAIFKYRLYDIDLVINRTLVYGALTVCVVGIYILVVGYLGALLRTDGNLTVSLVATGIVAVLFAPLRERLQRAVDRLMYGERDDPYAILSALGQHLEAALDPHAVLPTIADTVAHTLKIPYVAIELKRDGEYETVTEYGRPAGEPLRLPLVYGSETVGRIVLSPRAPGERFDSADRRLLDDLARQAGVAAHAARLTNDLQRSRERLVGTREEERRRIRRDLHDGLGPALSSAMLKLGAVRRLLPPGSPADGLLVEVREDLRTTVADVRELVYDLRPPALDQLGLVLAIRDVAERSAPDADTSMRITVEVPEVLPPLPAAVEVAAYHIAREAITNAARHARANLCRVRLTVEDPAGRQELALEVTDDGRGLPAERRVGVGLSSMRERAEELGGRFSVEAPPGSGVRVLAHLPIEVSGVGQRVSGENREAVAEGPGLRTRVSGPDPDKTHARATPRENQDPEPDV